MITLNHIPTSEHELTLGNEWDAAAIRKLIAGKAERGEHPAYLLLGQVEAGLLKNHLASAFGEGSVTTLKDTYYLGLEVLVLKECESYFATVGQKNRNRSDLYAPPKNSLRDALDHRPWSYSAA